MNKACRLAIAFVLLWSAAASGADDLITVPGAGFVMGDASGDANERPRRQVVATFRIMSHEVTNREFTAFVTATGHITDVEKTGAGYVWRGRWRLIRGADWRHRHGPADGIKDRAGHPVVQVSATDAAAYCRWRSLRPPGEAEWEFAAGGADGRRYPWGDAPPTQSGTRRANFGTVACCAADGSDGYARTAPVGRYPAGASPFGLMDMAGNVWEWTADDSPGKPGEVALRGGGWGNDPYCLRTGYRHGNPPDIGLDMVGFRCAGEALRGSRAE